MIIFPSEKVFIIYKDQRITSRDTLKFIKLYSQLIKEKSQNSRIAICQENRPEWVYAFLGGWQSNKTVIPIDFMSTSKEIEYIQNDSDFDLIFCSNKSLKIINDIKSSENFKKVCIINIDELQFNEKISCHNFPDSELQFYIKSNQNDIEDDAVVIYTSGTTGNPKGVVLSFKNLLFNLEAVSEGVKIFTPNDRVLAFLPFHHIFPLAGTLLAPFVLNAQIIINEDLTPEIIFKNIKTHKITIMIAVPRFYALIHKKIFEKINNSIILKTIFRFTKLVNNLKFSQFVFKKIQHEFGGSMRFFVAGGAALDGKIGVDLKALGFDLLEGYGMSETAPIITFTRPQKYCMNSAGKAIPKIDLQIIDGEITVSGPNVMKGYLNKPIETAEVIREGKLFTGDLGHLDSKGRLFITGRKKEIIVLQNGKNISPYEIENKILTLSKYISEVGVFAKDDRLTILIYPNFDEIRKDNLSSLKNYFQMEVVNVFNSTCKSYQKISNILITQTELPKTRLGKLKRHELHLINANSPKAANNQNEETGTDKTNKNPNDNCFKKIEQYFFLQKKIRISITDHLEFDLSLDSLDRVMLEEFVSKEFQIAFQENEFQRFYTINDLYQYLLMASNTTNTQTDTNIQKNNNADYFHRPEGKLLYFTLKFFMSSFVKLYFKIVIDKNNLKSILNEFKINVEQKGASAIFIANHQSFLDGVFATEILPHSIFKDCYFFAKDKHLKRGGFSFLAKRSNIIPINLNHGLNEALEKLHHAVKQKKHLIIFPEGTRSPNGDLQNFQNTYLRIAKDFKLPIYPIIIDGAHKALQRNHFIPHYGEQITIKLLPPIDLSREWDKKSFSEISKDVMIIFDKELKEIRNAKQK